MVMMQRLDNTQWGSVDIAKEKARSAVALRRPTKALQDGIAQGGANLRLLSTGFSVLEGGIPIVHEGKVIGSIGVSGVTSQQDAQTAQAGHDALKELHHGGPASPQRRPAVSPPGGRPRDRALLLTTEHSVGRSCMSRTTSRRRAR